MKTVIISAISGAIGAGLMLSFFQPSYAEQVSERARTMIQDGSCQVNVDYGRMNLGPRCFRNEVMTGHEGDYIYCANIQVTCN